MTTFETARSPDMLEHRPEARAFKIEDLMLEIRRGRLRIPSFQRRLVWDREDARKLVDSLYLGYPVGTLLLWETSAPADQMQWGGLRLHAEARPDALLVVDGQQRLVSLARILLTTDDDADHFALYFDLDRKAFVLPPSPGNLEDDPARWLPLNRLLDSEQLFEWLYEREPSRERRERALQLGKRIREYDLLAQVVRDCSEATLGEIRERIHSMGARIHPQQIERAVSQSKALAAFAPLHDHTTAIIRFLRQDAGVLDYTLLPGSATLVNTLGKFFRHHPRPRPRSRELLARWLWRSALSGASPSALGLIDPADEEGSVQHLLDRVEIQHPALPSVADSFNVRSASSKLQAMALLELQPRDLASGEPIDMGVRSTFVMVLKGRQTKGDLARSLANRLAHPARSGLRKALLQVTHTPTLTSHGISPEAFLALQTGDNQRFLALRAATLQQHFGQVFARHARWDASDRPSLASLVISDDEEDT
ncbi:DUF262 domain-containing protein [Sphaerotilus sp.]|uniref:DUF262 domain-containing protein n=1 Tax=Sphaerotilus sp. TaxID=2093942 RepID=UPI00286E5E82|nr:DUF262 domain-containing protein [Sphaerotilus sp.]